MAQADEIVIFDRAQLKKNRARYAANLKKHDFLYQWADEQLADRLKDIKRDFATALYIGHPPYPEHFITMNLDEHLLKTLPGLKVVGDEECLPFKDNSLDLVVSNLTLHAANDLPGVLVQVKRALKPDGVFLAAMLGGETLHELRASLMESEIALKGGASPRVFPFADKPQMGALMQRAGYALPVVDSEILTVTYPNIFKLMHDLRGMGEGNIIARRNKAYTGLEFFLKAGDHYTENFSDKDGKIRASFEVIFMIGWKPHESQQQALKPGSAKMRLADALNADEIQAGEKAAP